MALSKRERRTRIKYRIRKRVEGTTEKPRLTIFRSNKEIYAQIVDDQKGHTMIAATSHSKEYTAEKVNKIEQAKEVGKMIAQKALASGISQVVFDRNGFLYHGRVKSFAEAAREAGLKF